MKKILLTIVAIATVTLSSFGQAPEGFKYQAVVRDASNATLNTQAVGMQLTIQQGSIGGTAVYTETFAITTNAYGLVNLEIGTGTTTDDFSAIDWANGPYFMETAVDAAGGTNYAVMGTSQLMSVPYALHANTADNVVNDMVDDADASPTNELQALTISNDTIYLSNGGFAKLPATAVGFSGDYNDLTNQPTIPTVPTNVGDFINNAGYLTSFTEVDGSVSNEIQALSISNDTIYLSNGGFVKLPAGFDGDYNSLTNQPTIPTVPSNVSDFTNNAGYLTSFTEVDGSITNELQTLSMGNDSISLTNGGSVYLGGYANDSLWISTGSNISNTNTGNVGIGIAAPAYKLHVAGPIVSNSSFYLLNNIFGMNIQSSRTTLFCGNSGQGKLQIGLGDMIFTSGNTEIMRMNTTGLGVGTTAPSAKLDVVGTVQIVDGTEGAGRVLTSDATGNATWQEAGGQWNNLTLQNGWVHYAGFATPQYSKDLSGNINVKGLISSGTFTDATVLFNLPVGYRPTERRVFQVNNNSVWARVDVLINGDVICYGLTSNGWLNFEFNFKP